MGFLDFALGVLVGVANSNAKRNFNVYQKSNTMRETNADRITIQKRPNRKYVPKEFKYRFCPKCNKSVKVEKKSFGLKTVCPICGYQFKGNSPSNEEVTAQNKKIYDSIDDDVKKTINCIPTPLKPLNKKLIHSKEIQHKRLGHRSNYKRCPSCKMLVNKTKNECDYCGSSFDKDV